MNDLRKDPKVSSILNLAEEIAESHHADEHKRLVLTQLEKSGIIYVLNELPEGQPYHWYCEKLDEHIVNEMLKRRRK